MNKIFVFTDGSMITKEVKRNKTLRDIGTASVIFNKNKEAIKKVVEVPNCKGSTHSEMFAIFVAFEELIDHHTQEELASKQITLFSDCQGALSFIKMGPGKKKNSAEQREMIKLAEYIQYIIGIWELNVEFKHVKSHVKSKYATAPQTFNNMCNSIALSAARKLSRKQIDCVSQFIVQ